MTAEAMTCSTIMAGGAISPEVPTRAPVDIEKLIQWALRPGAPGGIPWRDEAALSMNRGCTVLVKRQRGNWATCMAGVSVLRFPGPRTVVLDAIGDGDGALVFAAIRALPGEIGALVVHHGRRGTRPPWTDRVETHRPKLSPATGRPWIEHADPKRRARPYCVLLIDTAEMVTETAICRYRAWHDAVERIAAVLEGRLERWEIRGFAAPAEPWLG